MAYDYDGIDDRLHLTQASSAAGDWSFGCWFNADNAGESSVGALYHAQHSNASIISMVRFDSAAAGRIVAHHYHSVTQANTTTAAFATMGTWYAIVVTYTAADKKMRIYKGTLTEAMAEVTYVAQPTPVGSVLTSATVVNIGNRTDTATTFNGRITRAFLSDRLVTLTEMESYRAGAAPPSTNLRAYWSMATDANDTSGNAAHLTVVGAILTDDPFGSTASATSTLPAFTSSSTTTAASTASADSTLPSPTTTASTTSASAASITSILPSPTTTAAATSADNSISATAASTLPAFTSQSTTSLTSTSTISSTLPTLSTLAAAALTSTSTISSTLPLLDTSISAYSGSQAPQVIQISPLLLALEGELAYTTSQIAIGV